MSGESLWNRTTVETQGKSGEKVTASFKYLGEGQVVEVHKGCSCTSYYIKKNEVFLTVKKSSVREYTIVASAEVANGKDRRFDVLTIKHTVTK